MYAIRSYYDTDGTASEPPVRQDTVQADAPPLLEVSDLVTRFEVRRGLFGRHTGNVHAVESYNFV